MNLINAATTPSIAVIMPVWNGREYIGEAIDSLLNQTLLPAQVIVIDDGSTDGTLALLEEYASKHPQVQPVRAAHGGVSAARNKGLSLVSSDYVYFMDADDVVAPELFADFARVWRDRPDLELFGFSARKFNNAPLAQRQYEGTHPRHLSGELNGGAALLSKLIARGSAHRVLWTSIISKALIDRINSPFLPIQNHEDAPFMFGVYTQARQAFFTSSAYYLKRVVDTSLSISTRDFSWVKNYFIARENTDNALRQHPVANVDRELVDGYYAALMGGCLIEIRKNRMDVPREYDEKINRLARQMTRNNLKLRLLWRYYPLYSGLLYCKRLLRGQRHPG
ncbi:glycosyltransferase family 2 protein [Erwinia tasmaniensis]|uniref:glycosyltransferase family 2 protein n=1 Tax=Erwinia tasmaniensis TaxID=338565 RepID=UPI003A4DB093